MARGVDGTWVERLEAGAAIGGAEVVLPIGAAVVSVASGPIERRTPVGWERVPGALVIGVQTQMRRYRVVADTRVLHVRLAPGALAGLGLGDAAAVVDRAVGLAEVGQPAAAWQRAVAADDGGADEVVAALERRLAAAPELHEAVALALAGLGGEPEIEGPPRVSERQLLRLFQAQVGVSLRTLRELSRVRRAIAARGRGESWAHAAAAAGFADQSHLVRVLRRVTGLTPTGLERAAPGAVRAVAAMSE